MKYSTRKIEDVVVIDADGKILLGNGDAEIKKVLDDLLEQGQKKILLNLGKVPYIDSAGLGELIRGFTAVRKNGGHLKLLSPNPRIKDLLNVTKLLNVFDTYDNEQAAVASFPK